MTKNNENPMLKIAGWFIALFAFAVGFWHTYLGLKEFHILSSDYGGLIVSALILLIMLVSYASALSGKKIALLFYVFAMMFFFVFNLNSFYPSYLGRTLIKEEAIALNDSLQTFSNRLIVLKKNRGDNNPNTISATTRLTQLRNFLVDEIKNQSGFGPRAKNYLREFNSISNSNLLPNITIGNTQEERHKIAERYGKMLDDIINDYTLGQFNSNIGRDKEASTQIYLGIKDIEQINKKYTPLLKHIIANESKVNIDSIRTNPEVITMQSLVTEIDNATTMINEGLKSEEFARLNEAKTRNLGKFAHTISSVKERINKIDTWGIIAICLLIDVIVPLAMFFLIRGKDDEDSSRSVGIKLSFWDKLWGKTRNFNS